MRGRRPKRPEIPAVLTLLKRTGFFRKRKGLYLLLTLILILLPLFFKAELGSNGVGSTEHHTVDRVVDGDTVVLQDTSSTYTRYLGIDAPEILTEESPGDPLSEEAKNLNRSLVDGKTVRLEFDEEKYDDYGRMLAYVFVDGTFVNKEMVRRGLAKVLIIKPNDRYASEIYEAEEQAKRERRGIWGNLSSLKPPSENTNYLIKPSQASRYIGQRVVVRGKITDLRKSSKVLVLKMEEDLDVVIFSGDWENFSFFDIAPEEHYVGMPVEVTGRVKMYRGKPQIIIGHPISIRGLR